MFRTTFFAALAAAVALPVFADGITIEAPYARASTSLSKSGAIFMVIHNETGTDDRVIAARAPVAERVELHTHLQDANGVMRMVEVEDGFAVAAGGHHMLKRGGDHVMLMGLTEPLTDGKTFPLTLVFETAGEVTVEVPVDLQRQPMTMMPPMDHGKTN